MTGVAIVGGGAAGISAAYRLRGRAHVTLFEAAALLGGHARTVEVFENGEPLGLDVGFVVYNEGSYPKYSAFLAELGVDSRLASLSMCHFARGTGEALLSDVPEREPGPAGGWAGVPEESDRFLREAPRHLVRGAAAVPLGHYLDHHGYSVPFRRGPAVMLACAAWSLPPEVVWEAPTSAVLALSLAHGRHGLGAEGAWWRTVVGGSASYVTAAQRALEAGGVRLRTRCPVRSVLPTDDGVDLITRTGTERFDAVVLATHADQALDLLAAPLPATEVLGAVRYRDSTVVLHQDSAEMPTDRRQWRALNFAVPCAGSDPGPWATYHLNALQRFQAEHDYFLSMDPERTPNSVLAEFRFRHPVLDTRLRNLQQEDALRRVNRDSRVLLAGSYLHARRVGPDNLASHEAAHESGLDAADAALRLLARSPQRA